jgi:WD40 repeat protein
MPYMPKSAPKVALRPEAIGEKVGVEMSLGAPVVAVLALDKTFAFATGEGRVVFAAEAFSSPVSVAAHEGVILSAAVDGDRSAVLTGGEDGHVRRIAPDGIATDLDIPGRKWVDHVAAHASGARAWSIGKVITVVLPGGDRRTLNHASTIGGLAFTPRTARLAVGHYGGATLWAFEAGGMTEQSFRWKGSHLDVTTSPDEKFLVTCMSENVMHGWRISDGTDMAMRGYPAKPRPFVWLSDERLLATAGAEGAIVWPFKGPKGPMGQSPDVVAARGALVSAIAAHPAGGYLAIGYRDGALVLARVTDKNELLVRRERPAASAAPITAIAWSPDAKRLAYGTDDGQAGIVDLDRASRDKAVGK